MRLTRWTLPAVLAAVAFLAAPAPAVADGGQGFGGALCQGTQCTVTAGVPGAPAAPAAPAAAPRAAGGGGGVDAPAGGGGLQAISQAATAAGCAAIAAANPVTGALACVNAVQARPAVAPAVPPAAAPLAPAVLAQRAASQLRLPAPLILTNPPAGREQLVGVPTWLWLGGGWAPVSATAAVPGVSVTATATPQRVVWSMGDGTSVTCRGPGTAYSPADNPASASPDCGHTYTVSSARAPGGKYPVTATLTWTVTWAGAGTGGAFPGLTTTTGAQLAVAESQALVTGASP